MAAIAVQRRGRFRRRTTAAIAIPPLTGRLQVARATCVGLFVLSTSLLAQLLVVSSLQQHAAQQRAYDSLRADLAEGTAPVGPLDADGRALAAGSPMAYLEIPAIGLRQVVGEGTTPGNLFDGPGHRRDSPFPGQVGTSVVMGRRGAFGGPFARLDQLAAGDTIRVTTGVGVFEFEVLGVRKEGEPAPRAAESGAGRLLLVTAGGRPYVPTGVLRVDAELTSDAVAGAAPLVAPSNLPAPERVMGADTSTLWALALWLQALVILAVASVWAWHRWGRARAWIVFLPPLMFVGISATGEAARLLPNLL